MARDTRKLIIESYLRMLSQNPLLEISLDKIALDVGISKTAIFRYFPKKQDLEDSIVSVINQRIDSVKSNVIAGDLPHNMEILLNFLKTTKHHYPILVQMFFTRNFNIPDVSRLLFVSPSFPNDEACLLYRFLFFFVFSMSSFNQGEFNGQDIPSYIMCMMDFYRKGLGYSLPGERQIGIEANEIADDRFLNALNEVILHYGMHGVSIGRLSQQLNLSNSTLYSFFSSKEDLIERTATREFLQFLSLLDGKLRNVQTKEEAIVTHVAIAGSFLSQRPPLSSFFIGIKCMKEEKAFKTYPNIVFWQDRLSEAYPFLGKVSIMLPVALKMSSIVQNQHELSQETMLQYLFTGCQSEE
ncbi:MAG: TetR/AcrR family transcriptional regulator [Sphaerochaetaceae bacterium]